MVPARPAFIGSDGWVRSKAWHWVFSSKLNTIARAGGFTYSPTTSTSLASKCGSLLTLNVSTRHGFKLWSAQIVATASLPIPTRAARVRVLHCVDPSAGRSLCVSRNTSSTMPGGRLDLRPRPLAITPTPPVPCSANRERHRRTVSESTSQRRAISSLATPSLAHNSPRACITCRCGNDVDAAIRSNSARWASLTGNAAAVITGILQNTVLIHRQTARRVKVSEQRTAIVTGAARGIGAAVAKRLASDGLAVAVLDLDEDSCAGTVDAIVDAGGKSVAVGADVSMKPRWRRRSSE